MHEAHELFEASYSLIKQGEQSAAAASAAYQLAESLLRLPTGSRISNLIRALDLSRAALDDPARHTCPIYHARSLDQLARIKRAFYDQSSEQIDTGEIRGLYKQALRVLDGRGLHAELQSASVRVNLSNLEEIKGNHKKALSYRQEAVRNFEKVWQSAEDFPDELKMYINELLYRENESRLSAIFSLANSLSIEGQYRESIQLYESVIHQASSHSDIRTLSIINASYLAVIHFYDHKRALSWIKSVSLLNENFELLTKLALTTFELLKGEDEFILHLLDTIDRRLDHERAMAPSGHMSNVYAKHQQKIASIKSIFYLERGKYFLSFATLERVMGFSFTDFISKDTFDLRDPVENELFYKRDLYSIASNVLDELSLFIPATPHESYSDLLEASLGMLDQRELNPPIDLEKILNSANVPRAIKEYADQYRDRTVSMFDAHERRRTEKNSPFGIVEHPAFALAAHADHLFIVVHIEHPGIAVASWIEEGAPRSKGVRFELDPKHLEVLWEDATSLKPLTALGEAFAKLLPSDALARHLVIIPSLTGHRIPWAAVPVAEDVRLVEVVRSIAIAPCLAPYAITRAPTRPRQGTVFVAPGTELKKPVYGDRIAFAGREGRRLEEKDAHLEAVLEAAETADVLAFYTHGQRGEGALGLELVDEPFSEQHMGARERLAGMERVELWACSTGFNSPTRLLLPATHDAYGIDVEFLRAGVRTSIGTLWDVTDATTGLIAGRYGEALAGGRSAVEALAEAQRWYLREFLPQARSQPDEASLMRLLTSHELRWGSTLGEAPRADTVAQLEDLRAWAGFRFIGVPEDRPEGEWYPTPPLTDDDRAWLEAALAEPEEAPIFWMGERWFEGVRREALSEPTFERALGVADAYRLRLEGRRNYNLALALAWGALAEHLTSDPTQARRAQRQEAWTLFEAFVGERPAHEMLFWPPMAGWLPVARAAAERLGGAEGGCLTALIEAHATRPWLGPPSPTFVERVLSEINGIESLRTRAEVLTAVSDLAWSCGDIPEHLIERLVDLLISLKLPKGEAFWAAQLQSRINLRVCLLRQRHGDHSGPGWWGELLPNADLAASIAWAGRLAHEHDEATDMAHKSFSEDAQQLQSRVWGRLEGEDLANACRRTASPDDAWHCAIGGPNSVRVKLSGGENARHILTELCLSCDPGLARAAKLKWLGALLERGAEPFSALLGTPALRRTVLRIFAEVTTTFYSTGETLGATPVEALADAEGWALRTILDRHIHCDPSAPAILALERALEDIDGDIERVAGRGTLLGVLEKILELRADKEALYPKHFLEEIERWLGERGANTLMLGLGFGIGSQVVLALYGELGGRGISRATRSEVGVAPGLMNHLTHLLRLPEMEGGAEARHESAWRALEVALAPRLEALLGDLEIPRGARLLLCAPGPFRHLPLWALEVRGRSLLERFDEVIHLPSHTLSTPSGPGASSVAQIGGEGHPIWRELAGLDRADRLSDTPARAADLPEIRALARHPQRRVVRIFGEVRAGSTSEMAGVIVGPERRMLPQNLDEPTLLGNEVVELWFPTTGGFDSLSPLYSGVDQLPAWVEHAFTSGAGTVIDLAWRVPEPVLWTVIAHYCHARRRGASPERALNIGLRACRAVIRTAEEGATQAARALRGSWRAAGLSRAPALVDAWKGKTLITALHRRHLGAFRLWGPAR
ncbi:CHAT domain-containing protein [Myxococcota bacterium]|nr:CHAT domain-containing protein [Myxococcota bacterium]